MSNAHVDTARDALLNLHKSLLDHVRIEYEREHGRVETAGALLQLVVGNPAFEWLRPLSQLIVAIDELEPEAGLKVVRAMVQKLVEKDDKFSAPYQQRLQDSPNLIVMQGRLNKALADQPEYV